MDEVRKPRQKKALDKQKIVEGLLAKGYNQNGIARLLGVSRQRINCIINAEKNAARDLLNKAIKKGYVTRPETCSTCGVETLPQGHHDDYSQPYKVLWLCQKCHTEKHLGQKRNYRERGVKPPIVLPLP